MDKIILLYIGSIIILKVAFADVIVYKNHSNRTIEIIGDLPAFFGPPIPSGGLKGYVVYASPPDACVPPVKPPQLDNKGPYIALVRRFNCSFVTKILNAQLSGYKAVIVRNVGSNDVENMNGDHDTELVQIPSVFIGQDDGILIQDNFLYDSGYFVIITDDLPFNIQNYLLPFAITIAICFVLMLSFMLVKCIRDYRKSRRHRLSSRSLKKLPIHKFKKGDPYECCAVCLDDYADNDKLRILPCSHAYHSKCIDPWLTKNRRVCPVCKRKVLIDNERPSDIDTDSEDESAPLINAEAGTQGGTFASQRDNPFREAERAAESRRANRRGTQSRYHHLEESTSEEDEEEEGGSHNINPARRNFDTESQDDAGETSSPRDRPEEIHVETPSEAREHRNTKDCIA